jgi:hypothetical protein
MRFNATFVAAAGLLALAGASVTGPAGASLSPHDECIHNSEPAVYAGLDLSDNDGSDDEPVLEANTGIGGYLAGGACNGCGDFVKTCLKVCHSGPSKDCDSYCHCVLTNDPKARCRYLGKFPVRWRVFGGTNTLGSMYQEARGLWEVAPRWPRRRSSVGR